MWGGRRLCSITVRAGPPGPAFPFQDKADQGVGRGSGDPPHKNDHLYIFGENALAIDKFTGRMRVGDGGYPARRLQIAMKMVS
jgi:hypothetical protein